MRAGQLAKASLTHGEQCEAQVDGVAHEAIGAGCDEARALICLGHKAPRQAKLGAGFEDEGRARQSKKAP